MSATPDLDALTARAEQLAGTCTCDTHTLIRDLLTYATTVRQERDEARVAGWCDACAGTGTPASGVRCMCAGTGHASDAVIHLRERLYAAEQQVAALTAQLAEARAKHLRNAFVAGMAVGINGTNRDGDYEGAGADEAFAWYLAAVGGAM